MKPILLIVLDGWGIGNNPLIDATEQASIPYYRNLLSEYPHAILDCCGEAVGLPAGQMGNSEVGHLNLGAGRIVYQDYARINRAIRNGDFYTIAALVEACRAASGDKALHLLGLVSDGGVHSHISHLYALIEIAVSLGVQKVFIHAFMDGRDTAPASGINYIKQLESHIHDKPQIRIATVIGRFWAMDRDRRWKRVAKAFEALVSGTGEEARSASEAVELSYEKNETDEFIQPTVICDHDGPVGRIRDGDSVIFFNFRADRSRELTRALTSEKFSSFERSRMPGLSSFVTMTLYDKTFPFPAAFAPVPLKHILGEVLSGNGMKQYRISETEKYAHVTYFFNGGEETAFTGEDRRLVPSPKDVATYDLKPEMSAYEVTDEVVRNLDENKYDFILLNFANPDMVGHTGIMDAAIEACEAIDRSLKRICEKVKSLGGIAIITADHGNCEEMANYSAPHTAHTTNPVPFILMKRGLRLREKGILADVAPTVLDLMKIDKPEEMTGESLIQK